MQCEADVVCCVVSHVTLVACTPVRTFGVTHTVCSLVLFDTSGSRDLTSSRRHRHASTPAGHAEHSSCFSSKQRMVVRLISSS